MARTVEFRVKKNTASKAIKRITDGFSPRAQDKVVKAAASEVLKQVVRDTPYGKTNPGTHTRKAWKAQQIDVAHWKVQIDPANEDAIRVMGYLEFGTKPHGPVNAKWLYIPKTKNAYHGWFEGLVFGKDYVLAKWVVGITPLRIVERAREFAKVILIQKFVEHLTKLRQRAGV